MSQKKCNLLQGFLAVLIAVTMNVASASEFLKTYATDFSRNGDIGSVYKFKDASGKITYSSFIQHDFVEVEEVFIASPPSDKYINEARVRSDKLKTVAEELARAREKREKIRQEKEKQRLERLALINQSRPRVYERDSYAGYPYFFWGGISHGGGYWPSVPGHLPAVHPNSPSSSSSFLPALH